MATRTIQLVVTTDSFGVPVSFAFTETGAGGFTLTASSEQGAAILLHDILEKKRIDQTG